MTSIAARLIVKDLYLHRWLIGIAFGGGVASLLVTGTASQAGLGFGLVFYLTTVIAYGIVLVMHAVTLERNQKSLVFALSLPISPAEYLQAKLAAALISRSDALITLIIIVTNASVSVLFILMSNTPSLKDLASKDVPAWPPEALAIIGVELAVALIAIALPFVMRRAGRGLFRA